ncbi:MAG TPA: hypothetical protein PLI21_02960 [Methanomassiliicoccaceae archaeon]|jgi:hypothetical protein|nr:hypothetical protein [Euryarchaeota archaeon]HOB39038.1 hypothetical protein [Methanomassiliicoccaceae archaeon]HOK27965.1 hypothetical protein [Methanomassiliicoccaceae archaeon]HOL08269.1 hypothetical protein [Methanomassiliicoccaceae archaeon]HPT73855.1 hypothetical protein [Methanomassiliicoccaceae archaeon]
MSWEGDAAIAVGLVTRSAPILSKLNIDSTATNLVIFSFTVHPSLLDRARFSKTGIFKVIFYLSISNDNGGENIGMVHKGKPDDMLGCPDQASKRWKNWHQNPSFKA